MQTIARRGPRVAACSLSPAGQAASLDDDRGRGDAEEGRSCPDFRKAADWYSTVFNLDQVGATAHDVALPFGKKGEKPYGVSAGDVPLTHIICRSRPLDAAAGNGPTRRQARAVIDHIALTVADFDRERAKAQLAAFGAKNVRDGGPFSVYVDDPFGCELQIAGLGVTAICGAEARATCGDTR